LFRRTGSDSPGQAQQGSAQQGSSAPRAAGGEVTTDGSYFAIQCLTMSQDQRTVPAAQRAAQEALQAAPHFGASAQQLWLTCAKWPVKSPAYADRAIRAPGTPTILLVANTYDPATPVAWARAVDGQLANSVLVTNQGGGHGFYGMGSCTRNVVDSFLITGNKPAPGTTCSDRNPATPRRNASGNQ
jgi:hypothetical protein